MTELLTAAAGLGTGLVSFLGGTAFRLIFGEIVSAWNKKQDHAYEIERMKLQETNNAAQHARTQEAIRLQAELGVQTIRVAAEGEVEKTLAKAWSEIVAATAKPTGNWVIDAWNGGIRPLLATVAITAWVGNFAGWWQLSEDDWHLTGAVLGIFIADRSLFKRGKA